MYILRVRTWNRRTADSMGWSTGFWAGAWVSIRTDYLEKSDAVSLGCSECRFGLLILQIVGTRVSSLVPTPKWF